MMKNLKRFKRQLERDGNKVEAAKWDFFPTTFVLPVIIFVPQINPPNMKL